jgi:hypothetical protein
MRNSRCNTWWLLTRGGTWGQLRIGYGRPLDTYRIRFKDGSYSPDSGSCTTIWTVPATGSKLLGARDFITIDDPLSSSPMVSSEGVANTSETSRSRAGLGGFTHLPSIKLISIVWSSLHFFSCLIAFFSASTISPREILTEKMCPMSGPRTRIEQQSEILHEVFLFMGRGGECRSPTRGSRHGLQFP